jgi:hypothetical protein
MNRDSVYDQFVCRFWLSRWPLWSFLVASTYSILMLTLERYVAIVHPVFYKVRKQRVVLACLLLLLFISAFAFGRL